MDKRKKAINSLMGSLKIRQKVIGVAAAVAILLMLILALSGAASAQEIRFTGTVTDKNAQRSRRGTGVCQSRTGAASGERVDAEGAQC